MFDNPSIFAISDVFDNTSVEPNCCSFLRNWRSTGDIDSTSSLSKSCLKQLNISGSGQFSFCQFRQILAKVPVKASQLVVIDLREESHGFINQLPVSWRLPLTNDANKHQERNKIEIDEMHRLENALQQGEIFLIPDSIAVTVKEVLCEKTLVEESGATYYRFPVTDRHPPTNLSLVDQFIDRMCSIPSTHWLHFHCRAGKGRTTTFMIMYDMMQNCQKFSIDEIIRRHHLIGGSDLFNLAKESEYLERAARDRLNFIHSFYTYCQTHSDFNMKYSEWVLNHKNLPLI